jgi:hypothetical protein
MRRERRRTFPNHARVHIMSQSPHVTVGENMSKPYKADLSPNTTLRAFNMRAGEAFQLRGAAEWLVFVPRGMVTLLTCVRDEDADCDSDSSNAAQPGEPESPCSYSVSGGETALVSAIPALGILASMPTSIIIFQSKMPIDKRTPTKVSIQTHFPLTRVGYAAVVRENSISYVSKQKLGAITEFGPVDGYAKIVIAYKAPFSLSAEVATTQIDMRKEAEVKPNNLTILVPLAAPKGAAGDRLHLPLRTSVNGATKITLNIFAARHVFEPSALGVIPEEVHTNESQWISVFQGTLMVTVNGEAHQCSSSTPPVYVPKNTRHTVQQLDTPEVQFISVYQAE